MKNIIHTQRHATFIRSHAPLGDVEQREDGLELVSQGLGLLAQVPQLLHAHLDGRRPGRGAAEADPVVGHVALALRHEALHRGAELGVKSIARTRSLRT